MYIFFSIAEYILFYLNLLFIARTETSLHFCRKAICKNYSAT